MGKRKKISKNAPCLEGSRTDYCPHFLECGGCKYQMMTYDEQLSVKEKELRELYVPAIGEAARREEHLDEDAMTIGSREFDRIWEGIKESPVQEGYRNKMEFSFGDEYLDGPLALGMHKRGSHFDIVSVTECRIAHPDMRKILSATLLYFSEHEVPFFHRVRHDGYLRHLLVRRAYHTGEILVDLVTTGEERAGLLEGWRDAVLSCELEGSIAGILHTKNDRIADVVEDQGTEVLYGVGEFTEELLGLRFRITPFSFFQTNSAGAEVLYDTARACLNGGYDTVFDLYSGTGTITQLMSPVAREVIGVELVPEAVEAAKVSVKDNGITNCSFIAGDVLKALDDLKEKPDVIILDPPRDGVHPKALKKILDYGVDHIVYIACRPASLARDYQVFYHAGYRMSRLSAVDMFPFTRHVETVCLLSNRKPDSYVHLNLKMEDYYRIKDAEKEQGKK